jgi:hypothetical protein
MSCAIRNHDALRRLLVVVIAIATAACDAGERVSGGPGAEHVAAAEVHEARMRAQRELDVVARAALMRYAADPKTVPDYGLLEKDTTINVASNLTRDEGGTLTADALPSPTFALRSPESMQEEADRTNTYVHYIFIHSLKIEGDRATFWLGVNLKLPNRPEGSGTCCCSSEEVYVKRAGAWVYAETTSSICS